MTPKYALFGCNPLAIEVAWRLSMAGIAYILVDRDMARVEQAQAEGLAAQPLDYTDDDALRSIGIGSSIEGVFCLFSEDSENVFLAISARAMAPGLRIIAVCQTPEAAEKLLAAGASKVVDPYEISGARVHELIERPEVVELLEQTVFGVQDLNVAEITIPPGAWVDGAHLSDLRRCMTQNLILLGMVDLERGGELVFNAHGVDNRLDGNDVLVVIGPKQDIASFRQMICATDRPQAAT